MFPPPTFSSPIDTTCETHRPQRNGPRTYSKSTAKVHFSTLVSMCTMTHRLSRVTYCCPVLCIHESYFTLKNGTHTSHCHARHALPQTSRRIHAIRARRATKYDISGPDRLYPKVLRRTQHTIPHACRTHAQCIPRASFSIPESPQSTTQSDNHTNRMPMPGIGNLHCQTLRLGLEKWGKWVVLESSWTRLEPPCPRARLDTVIMGLRFGRPTLNSTLSSMVRYLRWSICT